MGIIRSFPQFSVRISQLKPPEMSFFVPFTDEMELF